MKSNEIIRVSHSVDQLPGKVMIFLEQREKIIEVRDTKIKQLEEMVTRLHKHVKIGGQPSTTDKQAASDPNIPSQVSSPPVPDRDGPVKSQFRTFRAVFA